MYGGSGKLGRGGAGVVKRNIHAPPINRNSTSMSGSRLSSGGVSAAVPRGRDGGGEAAPGPSTSARQAEETFSLVTGNPLNFAMALRLVPDLVEEINRVEAMGGTARIKFDSNANNANGNVINVGDKNFKFTWSREMGELCDIYEERKSGEDGNGLLIESGGAWRKLNVQRVLDESTKKHVKMRSEEAERKNKSRKSIVLDHQNSTMKNQMKALAAAESNSWRIPFKRKEPPFKKSKPEPSPGGPPKPVYKSGLSTTNPSKGRPSSGSPLSSQTEQYGAPAQPIGSSNLAKGFASVPDATPSQAMNKIASVDKEMPSRLANSTVRNKPKHNQNVEAKPVDLRSFMISLLMETDGMNLRALEKAVADAMPNSVRQIQPVLKQIANFQAPGRYFLKSGVDLENFKKPSSGSGSSPEINWHRSPAPDKFDQLPDQDHHGFSLRKLSNELVEQTQLNSVGGHTSETMEKIDVLNNSPDNSNGKKVSDNSEAQAGSSSDGGSDSDSESNSSDSGSDSESHSRGKSISPVGSGSGSSSDSESDVSSSSKQASDEDVDIMTSDDDKELKHKLQDSEPVSSKSPLQLRPQDSEPIDIGNYEKLDDQAFDVVEIEKDDPEDGHEAEKVATNYLFSNEEGEEPIEEIRPSSANHHERNENQGYDRKLYGTQDSEVNVSFKHGHSDSYARLSRGKSKRHSNDQHSVDRPYNSKKLKGKNLNQPLSGTINSLFGESPQNSSPDRPLQGPYKGSINQMANRAASDGTYDPNLQIGFDQGISTGSVSESQFPGQRSFDASGRAEGPYGEKRPGKRDNLDFGVEESERGLETSEGLWIRNQVDTGLLHKEGFVSERRPAKFSVEDVGDKNLTITESIPRKPKIMGKVKDTGRHSNTRKGYSPRDNDTGLMVRSPVINGRDGILQRELSDLELGEFREPLPDEISEPRKQFERKGNFRQLENKPTDSECRNSDSHRGKPSKKISADSRKLSQENSDAAVSGILDGPSKRRPLENYANDLSTPHLRETQPVPQQHQSSAVQTEFGSHHSKISEMSGKSRYVEADTVQRTNLETCGDKKMPVNAIEQQHGPKRAVVSNSTKESKKQEPNMIGGSNDKRKDASSTGSYDVGQKRRESSSDERDCSYMKYEKEEPELKGSIKNLSEYKEYVKEFQEKYESYCSLNKILESYRDEFSKLGKDLEACRGRDDKRYHDLLGQMRSSFLQCGQKHKRLKKIFSVLHEELKHLKQMMRDYAASYTKD